MGNIFGELRNFNRTVREVNTTFRNVGNTTRTITQGVKNGAEMIGTVKKAGAIEQTHENKYDTNRNNSEANVYNSEARVYGAQDRLGDAKDRHAARNAERAGNQNMYGSGNKVQQDAEQFSVTKRDARLFDDLQEVRAKKDELKNATSAEDKKQFEKLEREEKKLTRKIGEEDVSRIDAHLDRVEAQVIKHEATIAFGEAMKKVNLATLAGSDETRRAAEAEAVKELVLLTDKNGNITLGDEALGYLPKGDPNTLLHPRSPQEVMLQVSKEFAGKGIGTAVDAATLQSDINRLNGVPEKATAAAGKPADTKTAVMAHPTQAYFDAMKEANLATTTEAKTTALKKADDAMQVIKADPTKFNSKELAPEILNDLIERHSTQVAGIRIPDQAAIKKELEELSKDPNKMMLKTSEVFANAKIGAQIKQEDIDTMRTQGSLPPKGNETGSHDAGTTGVNTNTAGTKAGDSVAKVETVTKTTTELPKEFVDKYKLQERGLLTEEAKKIANAQVMLEKMGFATDNGGSKDGVVDAVKGTQTNKAIAKAEAVLKDKLGADHTAGQIDEAFLKALAAATSEPVKTTAATVAPEKKEVSEAPAKLSDEVLKVNTVAINGNAADAYKFAGTQVITMPKPEENPVLTYNDAGKGTVVETTKKEQPVVAAKSTENVLTQAAGSIPFTDPAGGKEIDDAFVQRMAKLGGLGGRVTSEKAAEKMLDAYGIVDVDRNGHLNKAELVEYLNTGLSDGFALKSGKIQDKNSTLKPEFDSLLKEYGIERKSDATYVVADTKGHVGQQNVGTQVKNPDKDLQV